MLKRPLNIGVEQTPRKLCLKSESGGGAAHAGRWQEKKMSKKADFTIIIKDNENSVQTAFDRGDYLQAFLLIHALIESLLRQFLNENDEEVKFSTLINRYELFLKKEHYECKTLVNELTQFNRRRNRIIHQLWKKGYSNTNSQSKEAAEAALTLYSLAIEFLETWDQEITKTGFEYS